MDWKQVGITAAITVVVTFLLTWLWRDSVWKADIAAAPRDTVLVLYEHETPPYSASGTVPATSPRPSETGKPRPVAPLPLIVPPATNSSADSFNCEHTILLNTIGRLNAELAQYKDVDSFSEDSLRYSLAVTWDGSKPVNERWWRWLQIKPYPYSDTLSTITQTVVTANKMDWPWLVAVFAVGMAVMAIFYTVAFK